MAKETKRAGLKRVKRACGLCGNTRKLTKTECCDNWICNDEHKYVMFSFARNSCHRNHRRYTLCGYHHVEGHEGKWQECVKCKEDFSESDYDELANEDSNFEKLEDFSKIKCVCCNFKSESKEDFAFQLNDDYYCKKDDCQKMGKPPPRKSTKRKDDVKKVSTAKVKKVKKACGLCGKTRKLIKTECCDNWICDDEHKYVMFSYARNSCHRNHRRYTLCGYHHVEGHEGKWQECLKCKEEFSNTDYEEFASDEYNFRKLEDAPKIT